MPRHRIGRNQLDDPQSVPAIRERTVAMLRNASEALAKKIAMGLGIDPLPAPLPLALSDPAAGIESFASRYSDRQKHPAG